MKPTERDIEKAGEWLMDRANPEDEGGLGCFADTRFSDDLAAFRAQAREEGRQAGLEEAAIEAQDYTNGRMISCAIRALKTKEPKP
jgi:hypothetical protein